jgi:hypothetical protein
MPDYLRFQKRLIGEEQMFMVSLAEQDALKTKNGGWTKEQLAKWGVRWPPVKGWRQRLDAGLNPNANVTRQPQAMKETSWHYASDIKVENPERDPNSELERRLRRDRISVYR